MSEREPGRMAYETFSGDLWVHLPESQRWHWTRVESTIRADEAAKVRAATIEEAANDLAEMQRHNKSAGPEWREALIEARAAIRAKGAGGFNEMEPHKPMYPRSICTLTPCKCTGEYVCDEGSRR